MPRTARHIINEHHMSGIVVVAALFGLIAGSFPLFIVIVVGLVTAAIASGDIRLGGHNPRR